MLELLMKLELLLRHLVLSLVGLYSGLMWDLYQCVTVDFGGRHWHLGSVLMEAVRMLRWLLLRLMCGQHARCWVNHIRLCLEGETDLTRDLR